MERRRRRKWDQHVTRMHAETLVKISREIYLSEEDLQDALKEDGATKSWIKTDGIAYKKGEEEDEEEIFQ